MMRRWIVSGALTLAAVAACGGGIRPSYAPLPEAMVDTLSAAPPAAVAQLATTMVAEGLRVQWRSDNEGYLESQWFDLVTRQNGSFDRAAPERYVRFRFFVDPLGTDRSVVHAEVVVLRTVDPSVMERDAEMMAPPGNGGRQILTRVLQESARGLGG